MKYRTDLILGEAFCLFISFYFLDSGLSVLNGLQFYFWLRESENREYGRRIGKKVYLAPHNFVNVTAVKNSLSSFLVVWLY